MTVLASLLERYATPALLAEVQASSGRGPGPRAAVAQLRSLIAGAPREDQNRFEACLPLFPLRGAEGPAGHGRPCSRGSTSTGRSRCAGSTGSSAWSGVLEIRTAAHKIQEILDFARAERIPFLEETCIVTLCQLLSRSIIEQSREYFNDPGATRGPSTATSGAPASCPPQIMIGPLVHSCSCRRSTRGHRAPSPRRPSSAMDLSTVAKSLPRPAEGPRRRGDRRRAEAGDRGRPRAARATPRSLTSPSTSRGTASPSLRRVAVRVLAACARRGRGGDGHRHRPALPPARGRRPAVRTGGPARPARDHDDYAAQIVSD